MKIFIPSYGRAGRATTLDMLPVYEDDVVLCVRQSQRKAYEKAYHGYYAIRIIPDSYPGIIGARTWICRYAIKHRLDVIGMFDDDKIGGWWRKPDPSTFGGLVRVPDRALTSVLDYHERAAQRHEDEGYAASLCERRILAYPHGGRGRLKIGLTNGCLILNTQAMRKAQFTIEACEDVESTLAWYLAGVHTGQDSKFGHGGQKGWAIGAAAGGVGDHRAKHPDYKSRNHRRLMKLFPECVGYTTTGKERTYYRKAYEIGSGLR